ncbi:MAG: hypothetical protein Q8M83_00565 [bacterium]|nr:hypothetical protein [bacterium]
MSEQTFQSKAEEFISWKVSEYPHYEHGLAWYVGMGIMTLILLLYAVWTQNLLFAFIIIMFAIVFFLHSGRMPNMLRFSLTEDGVILGEKTHPWKSFNQFSIVYEPPEVKNLYLEFNGMRPNLAVSLEDSDPGEVRRILLKFLREDVNKTDEPISDWLGRILKI